MRNEAARGAVGSGRRGAVRSCGRDRPRRRTTVEQLEAPSLRLLLLDAAGPRQFSRMTEQVRGVEPFAGGQDAEQDDPRDQGDRGGDEQLGGHGLVSELAAGVGPRPGCDLTSQPAPWSELQVKPGFSSWRTLDLEWTPRCSVGT